MRLATPAQGSALGAARAFRLPALQLPAHTRRQRYSSPCCAASGAPWRYDDLSGSSMGINSSLRGITSFDDLWGEQLRAMQRAQAELAEMQRQMDQRFEMAQIEMQQMEQATGSGRVERIEGPGGPCGYRWQRSEQQQDGSYRAYRSESFTVVGVPANGCRSLDMYAAPPSALHLGPLNGAGLLLAAALAGFWAAATAAFSRCYHLTIYKDRSRWWMLLTWPLLLLFSSEFRQQFWAALRGRAAEGSKQSGQADGEHFVPSMPGKQV